MMTIDDRKCGTWCDTRNPSRRERPIPLAPRRLASASVARRGMKILLLGATQRRSEVGGGGLGLSNFRNRRCLGSKTQHRSNWFVCREGREGHLPKGGKEGGEGYLPKLWVALGSVQKQNLHSKGFPELHLGSQRHGDPNCCQELKRQAYIRHGDGIWSPNISVRSRVCVCLFSIWFLLHFAIAFEDSSFWDMFHFGTWLCFFCSFFFLIFSMIEFWPLGNIKLSSWNRFWCN